MYSIYIYIYRYRYRYTYIYIYIVIIININSWNNNIIHAYITQTLKLGMCPWPAGSSSLRCDLRVCRRATSWPKTPLGGSWVVISGVISKVNIVITQVRGLITPLITTHEPPSKPLDGLQACCYSQKLPGQSKIPENPIPLN